MSGVVVLRGERELVLTSLEKPKNLKKIPLLPKDFSFFFSTLTLCMFCVRCSLLVFRRSPSVGLCPCLPSLPLRSLSNQGPFAPSVSKFSPFSPSPLQMSAPPLDPGQRSFTASMLWRKILEGMRGFVARYVLVRALLGLGLGSSSSIGLFFATLTDPLQT